MQEEEEGVHSQLTTVLSEIEDIKRMNTDLQKQLSIKQALKQQQHTRAECTQVENDQLIIIDNDILKKKIVLEQEKNKTKDVT